MMLRRQMIVTALAGLSLTGLVMTGGCKANDAASASGALEQGKLPLTVRSTNGAHAFSVELAKTPEQQEKGLMFRTNIPKDEGMLFAPYPAEGGPPRVASFWMKNTPSSLDIIFIRADGTIATIAENTVPFSETPVQSGEPVAAVLELNGGRSSELGMAEGDKVSWPGEPGGK